MSKQLSASAQIEILARFMGWEVWQDSWYYPWKDGGRIFAAPLSWNPLESWDDFRTVEEKLMEDGGIHCAFVKELIKVVPNPFPRKTFLTSPWQMMKADLPTRVSALCSVLETYGK